MTSVFASPTLEHKKRDRSKSLDSANSQSPDRDTLDEDLALPSPSGSTFLNSIKTLFSPAQSQNNLSDKDYIVAEHGSGKRSRVSPPNSQKTDSKTSSARRLVSPSPVSRKSSTAAASFITSSQKKKKGTRSRTGRSHSARNLSSYFAADTESKENGGSSSNFDSDQASSHGSALKKPMRVHSKKRTVSRTKKGTIETRTVEEDRVETVSTEKHLAHRNVPYTGHHQHVPHHQVEEKSKSSDGGVFSTLFSPMYHLLNGAEEDAVEETSIVHKTIVTHEESSSKYVEFPSSISHDHDENELEDEHEETSSSSGDVMVEETPSNGSHDAMDLNAYCDEQLPYNENSTYQHQQEEEEQNSDDIVVEEPEPEQENMDKYCVSTNYYSTTTTEEVVEIQQADDGEMRLRQPYYLDEYDEFDPYWFISLLPPLSMAAKMRPACLPKKTRQSHPVTLVLDLDETLVHCSTDNMQGADLEFPVVFNGVEFRVSAKIRPFMEMFLKEVSAIFEVVVFTASKQVYADTLLDLLDPEHKYIKYRAFRDSCVEVEGNYLKDLTILGRDMSKTIIIDNSPHAYGFQIDNGIPIESWYDDEHDRELAKLLPFLRRCATADDVRPLLRQQFRQRDLVNRYKKQHGF